MIFHLLVSSPPVPSLALDLMRAGGDEMRGRGLPILRPFWNRSPFPSEKFPP